MGHLVSVATTGLCLVVKWERQRGEANEWAWLCSDKLYLLKQAAARFGLCTEELDNLRAGLLAQSSGVAFKGPVIILFPSFHVLGTFS